MRLCLFCRFISPSGSLHCGRCGRSFGGRLCPRHHLSPAGSQFCVECGRSELTGATLSLPLTWLGRLLAWAGVFLMVSLVGHHAGGVAQGLWRIISWGLIYLLDTCPCTLIKGLARVASWLCVLLFLSWLLPGTSGARLRAVLFQALRGAGSIAYRLERGMAVWLYHQVEGDPAPAGESEKKKKKH